MHVRIRKYLARERKECRKRPGERKALQLGVSEIFVEIEKLDAFWAVAGGHRFHVRITIVKLWAGEAARRQYRVFPINHLPNLDGLAISGVSIHVRQRP